MKTIIELIKALEIEADKCNCDGNCDFLFPHNKCAGCCATSKLNKIGEMLR